MIRLARSWRRITAGLAATALVVGCAASTAPSDAFVGATFDPSAWTVCRPSGFGAVSEMPGPCVKATTGLATAFAKGRVEDGYGFHLGAPSTVTLDLPYDFSILRLKNDVGKRLDLVPIRDAIVAAVNGGSLGRDRSIDGGPAPGREFVVEMNAAGMPAGHGMLVRLFAYAEHMWVLTAMMPLTELDSPDIARFVDSFEVQP